MITQSLLIVGTVIYVLAWLLPAFEHRNDMLGTTSVTVLQGWEAFWFALRSAELSLSGFLNPGSALTNLVLVTTLLDASSAVHIPHPVLRITLSLCALLNTHWWFRAESGSLRIGYYWWAGSFFLIGAGLTGRGSTAAWISTEGIIQVALLVVSASAVLAGIYVEWRRIRVDTKASEKTPPGTGTLNADDPKAPRDGHDEPGSVTPARRGSNWFLAGGIVAASLTWFLLSQTPRTPSVKPPLARSPQASTPPVSSSSPANGSAKRGADFEIGRHETQTSPLVVAPAVAPTSNEAPPVAEPLRHQARDLRRGIEPFLYDPSVRDAASEAERSLARGEDLLRRGDTASAALQFQDASAKLAAVRASARRTLELRRLAEERAQNAAAARQRFTRDQAIQYAQLTYSRGQQFEARADAAYRSRDYRTASSLYASANREYDTVLETIAQSRRAEEQEARDAARRLQEEQARELAKRQTEERAQRLSEQNALRAKATGKIHKVRLNFVTYGGGQNPEIEILVNFDVEGMKGIDGEVIVFLYSQQTGGLFDRGKGPFERLKGSGSDRNGVYAHGKYTPPYDTSQFSAFRLAIRTSRFTLPKGSNRVRAAVYLRTGGSGTLVRDLDGMSEDILLNQP
jgi:hypothetical protein